jgi:hypothetical protein
MAINPEETSGEIEVGMEKEADRLKHVRHLSFGFNKDVDQIVRIACILISSIKGDKVTGLVDGLDKATRGWTETLLDTLNPDWKFAQRPAYCNFCTGCSKREVSTRLLDDLRCSISEVIRPILKNDFTNSKFRSYLMFHWQHQRLFNMDGEFPTNAELAQVMAHDPIDKREEIFSEVQDSNVQPCWKKTSCPCVLDPAIFFSWAIPRAGIRYPKSVCNIQDGLEVRANMDVPGNHKEVVIYRMIIPEGTKPVAVEFPGFHESAARGNLLVSQEIYHDKRFYAMPPVNGSTVPRMREGKIVAVLKGAEMIQSTSYSYYEFHGFAGDDEKDS